MGKNRNFSVAFRIAVARRIVAGESVTALHHEYDIERSVLYRWRDALAAGGEAGLSRAVGRPPGTSPQLRQAAEAAGLCDRPAAPPEDSADAAAKRIAELERAVGKQALYIDFLTRAFKRVKEARRSKDSCGVSASTGRSGP